MEILTPYRTNRGSLYLASSQQAWKKGKMCKITKASRSRTDGTDICEWTTRGLPIIVCSVAYELPHALSQKGKILRLCWCVCVFLLLLLLLLLLLWSTLKDFRPLRLGGCCSRELFTLAPACKTHHANRHNSLAPHTHTHTTPGGMVMQ